MKKILRKIKKLFRRKPSREWVTMSNATETGFLKCNPKSTREMIEEAYPDGAKFLSQLSYMPECDGFLLEGGFASKSFVSARGINVYHMTYEELREFMEKNPGMELVRGTVILSPSTGLYSGGFKSAKEKNR